MWVFVCGFYAPLPSESFLHGVKMLERTVHYKVYGSWLRRSTCFYFTFIRRASIFQSCVPHIWEILEVSVEQITVLSFLYSPPYFLRILDLVQDGIQFTWNPSQLRTHYPLATNKARFNTSRAKEPLWGTKGKTDAPHSEEQIWDEVEPGFSIPPNTIITEYVRYPKNKSHAMSLN